jgi:hypothetical protein
MCSLPLCAIVLRSFPPSHVSTCNGQRSSQLFIVLPTSCMHKQKGAYDMFCVVWNLVSLTLSEEKKRGWDFRFLRRRVWRQPSGIKRCIFSLKYTDVSEVRTASIIKAETSEMSVYLKTICSYITEGCNLQRYRVFVNKVLKRTSGSKKAEVRVYNEKLHKIHFTRYY